MSDNFTTITWLYVSLAATNLGHSRTREVPLHHPGLLQVCQCTYCGVRHQLSTHFWLSSSVAQGDRDVCLHQSAGVLSGYVCALWHGEFSLTRLASIDGVSVINAHGLRSYITNGSHQCLSSTSIYFICCDLLMSCQCSEEYNIILHLL